MKINEILVEAPTNPRVAGGVPPAVNNLKANQARTAAFNQSKLAAQQAGTTQPATAGTTQTQPATAGTTQAQPATAGKLNPGKANSAVGSFLRGAGATQGADAVDAYATAQQGAGGGDGYFDHGQWIKGPKPGAQPTSQLATAGTTQAQPATAQAQPGAADQTQPATAQAQPTASGAKIYTDPAAFKAEWDKYVASKSATAPYHLISDPALLSVLKNMWMRTGGTSAMESKTNTRKAK